MAYLQPNNIRGHAFRSLVAHALATYGDPDLTIREEQEAHELFPEFELGTRSKNPKGPRQNNFPFSRGSYGVVPFG